MYFSIPTDLLKQYIIDHPRELSLLAIDLLLFGISNHYYKSHTRNIQCIQETQSKGANNKYKYNEIENNLTYGIVEGTIQPIGAPLKSLYNNQVTGVVRRLTITEHNISRNSAGYWGNYKRILDENFQTSPFYIVNNDLKIKLQDPLQATRLDLDVTYDKYDNVSSTVLDIMLGILSGSRQRGIQTTEEMLRTGCVVNVIGDILIHKDGTYTIAPPRNKPFIIITESIQTLLHSMESNKTYCKSFAIMFGCIAAVLISYQIRGFYNLYQEHKRKQEKELKLKASRKERRAATRDKNIIEELQCVVCQTNGREIVLMPCGHFCLCEDCSEGVQTYCPLCRTVISDRIPSYL